MNFTRVLIGALVIALAVIGREYAAASAATTQVTASFELSSPAITDVPAASPKLADQDTPRVDLYGNEVEDAIGDYRVDGTGDLYEAHSPDTEVTRLGAPGA